MSTTYDDTTTADADQRLGSDYLSRDRYGMYRERDPDRAATDPASDAEDRADGPGPRLMGADTLLGNDVYNRADEDLGDIKEIMLDMRSGKVAYAVLSFGGFLGMGEKLFAVPWSALELDTANHRFMLDVERETLKNAPGFDPDHWPDMADATWARDVHAFYGRSYEEPAVDDVTTMRGTRGGVMSGTALDPLRPDARVPTGSTSTGIAGTAADESGDTNRTGRTPGSIPVA